MKVNAYRKGLTLGRCALMTLCLLLGAAASAMAAGSDGITEALLKNLVYSGVRLHDGAAVQTLENDMGSAETKLTDFIIGKKHPDGSQDAAVRIVTTGMGTAAWADIYVVQFLANEAMIIGPFELGDHTQVKFSSIGKGKLEATLTVYGPDDAHCCPSVKRKDSFTYGPKGIDELGGVICEPGKRDGGPSGKDEQRVVRFSKATLDLFRTGAPVPAQ